ncbi:putative proton-coupled thiamine transporter YuaJ [Halobacteroides halobius DSM 5150]|uniref:Putative proton-coupled thiamine transporter YuaJ n=1 Tax=Halobacteroides halobius (strain ATCC 35273 / DSM 5150 / MD-1) TaxID=748449 RepID=L0K7H5_HALHC|nr:energy-coupled thiamine transporter ThiT [Halobacteroides halobius]AGB41242.1 putative proton-coupled thiamine transporter YuaJ [Halobacteroides halobius DSM 5150]
MKGSKVKKLAEMGVALALATIFNYLKIYQLPQGGSISLEMIPIIFIALRWGWREGFLVGTGYGILQAMLGGYIVHWAQLILDYPLAYGLLGLAGLVGNLYQTNDLKKKSLIISSGVLVAGFLRFLAHFITGVVFFGQYAPEGQSVWVYSLVYNASYLVPETIITGIVMLLLIKAIANNPTMRLNEVKN